MTYPRLNTPQRAALTDALDETIGCITIHHECPLQELVAAIEALKEPTGD